MTEVIAVSEQEPLNKLSAFEWAPLAGRPFGFGVAAAVLASAAAALAICAVLPRTANSSVRPTVKTAALAPPVAGFDVGKTWSEERALLYAATNPSMRGVRTDAWAPAGGLSILMATRFPTSTGTQTAAAEKAVPMPPPAPVAHVDQPKRQSVARGKPVQIEPKVASLPPQQPEPGYFGFFRNLFADPDHAAQTLLASNPKTAIYDIEKHVVYLPNGEKLEAHSGYGKYMDDPDSVSHKNLGVTPPNVYAVTFREKLFHGVRALRLTPVGGGKMYGRDGMLAHSYMLGEDGQSNGCVSLKDYDKFLQAYKDGKFEQLIVVRSVEEPAPAQVASAGPGNV